MTFASNDEHHTDKRGDEVVIISTIFAAFALFFVGLRCIARFGVMRICGADDIFSIFALAFSISFTVLAYAQNQTGLGRHLVDLSVDDQRKCLKVFWASVIMYYLTLTAIKMSILCQYLRFLVNPTIRRVCWALLAIVALYGVGAVLGSIFACTPVARFWDPESHTGHCINLRAFWFTNASLNIVSDIAIWILPMPALRSLQLPQKQKYSVILVFALGGCVCIISVVRLYSLYEVSQSTDFTWSNVGAAVWSSIEINVAIICACLPTLRALVNRLRNKSDTPARPVLPVVSSGPQRFTLHSAGVDRDDTLLRGEDVLYEMRCKEDWSDDGPRSTITESSTYGGMK